MIDLNKLRAITKENRIKNEISKNDKEKLELQKKFRQMEVDRLWSKSQFAIAANACVEGANEGEDTISFCKLKTEDCDHNKKISKRLECLIKMLENEGLKCSLEYHHDGMGRDAWYELYISWKEN